MRRQLLSLLLVGSLLPVAGAAQEAAPAGSPTNLQIMTFAKMAGRPEAQVAERVAADPATRDLVLRAVEAREARKAAGKSQAILGFSILGIGNIAGFVIMLSAVNTDVSTDGTTEDTIDGPRYALGIGVSLAATAVGLAIGIPGIVKAAKPGEIERKAVADYNVAGAWRLPTRSHAEPPILARHGGPRNAVTVPVLSFAF